MNPFLHKPAPVFASIQNFKQIYPQSYNKNDVDPYTKTRIILMNGTEFEANWFSHNFARHVTDNNLRRDLAMTRYVEKQQQLKISLLKPCNESPLETAGFTFYIQTVKSLTNVLQMLGFGFYKESV